MQLGLRESDRWVRRFGVDKCSGPRLLSFPHVGGSATYYFPLARLLEPEVEVLAIQYPGRQERHQEPLVDNIPELADRVAEALVDTLDRPYAVFGHSMGAILGYEVALRLADRAVPQWFFVSGRRAPSRYQAGNVHLRDDAGIVAELRATGGTDQRFLDDEELLATVLPVVRNDYKAIETYSYRPAPPLGCPATVLVGDSDPHVTADEAAAWRDHFSGPFECRAMAGGHFYLATAWETISDTIRAALAGSTSTPLSGESA